MPKISYSLAIAFALHIILFAVSTFLIDKGPTPFLIDPNNTINVHFGDQGSGASKKITSLKSSEKLQHLRVESVSGNAHTGPTDSTATGDASVSGNGSTSYEFGPSAISYQEPVYPRLAIKRELQGNVTLKISVNTEGKPSNTEILKSSGHDLLDKAALEAASQWRFQPKNSPYTVTKNIIFQLKN